MAERRDLHPGTPVIDPDGLLGFVAENDGNGDISVVTDNGYGADVFLYRDTDLRLAKTRQDFAAAPETITGMLLVLGARLGSSAWKLSRQPDLDTPGYVAFGSLAGPVMLLPGVPEDHPAVIRVRVFPAAN